MASFCDILEEMQEIYDKKNQDYGDSFTKSLDKYGLIAAVVRMEDKFNRISSLINKKAQVESESIKDTFLDLANYSAMAYMYLKNIESCDK